MNDVLSTTLQTPEHSGRVRGVGSFISPSKYFNMPKKKKNQISKAKMMVHEQETKDELEKTKAELERTKRDFSSQINELKAMMASLRSPNLSKTSCRVEELDELMANNEDDEICTAANPVSPTSPPEGDAGKLVHGMPLQPRHVRVSVYGVIKEDALVLVPIVGEIEIVCQAVGSYLA